MRLLLCACLLLAGLPGWAQVRVAVASNFQAPMVAILDHLALSSTTKVLTTYGASGKFHAQIRQGAPFDVFLSADQTKPSDLTARGLTVPDSQFTYAVGALALWSRQPDLIDAQATVLHTGRFNKLAIANPRHAPYGSAALAALTQLGLEPATRRQLVVGENIAQTFQFASSGNADLAFIARSQLLHPLAQQGSKWLVPTKLHPPIHQDAVLLSNAANNSAARWFVASLKTPEVQRIIESFGYLPVTAP